MTASHDSPQTPRPIGPLGRRLARAPIALYRIGLGRLLGRRFVMVEHTGRVSGLRRRVVLEVIDRSEGALMVAAAWPGSDWYLNLQAQPRAVVSSGRVRSVPAWARVLEETEAESVFGRYTATHPRAARVLARALGLPFADREAMAVRVPVVELSARSPDGR